MPALRASETDPAAARVPFARVDGGLPGRPEESAEREEGTVGNMAEVVAARLRGAGVDRVYGVPGPALDPLLRALEAPWFVQARGAESAALMACAHAKLTGRLGCCLAPPGAGVLRLLGGLYDAAADRAPVLALAGREDGDPAVRHLPEVSVFCEPVSRPGATARRPGPCRAGRAHRAGGRESRRTASCPGGHGTERAGR